MTSIRLAKYKTSKSFYYSRFSAGSIKVMGCFGIQLLVTENKWSIRYNLPKNDRYGNSSTEWTRFSSSFNIEKYGIRLT